MQECAISGDVVLDLDSLIGPYFALRGDFFLMFDSLWL